MRMLLMSFVLAVTGLPVDADEPVASEKPKHEKQTTEQRTVIASVFGEPLYLKQVTPASAKAKREELSQSEFDRWLSQYRGRLLYQNLWRAVLKRYRESEQIDVSQEEMAAIAMSVERRMDSMPDQPQGSPFTAQERKGLMVAWSRGSLLDWKVCKSLYEKYGGRVGIGSLGAWTAFDGQNALLKKHIEAGEIEFHHPEMEKAFWQHTKIKNFADAYPEGERLEKLLAKPPYLRN